MSGETKSVARRFEKLEADIHHDGEIALMLQIENGKVSVITGDGESVLDEVDPALARELGKALILMADHALGGGR